MRKDQSSAEVIAAHHEIEDFDDDYRLPNDAYLETCAAVGLAFFANDRLYFEI